MGYLILIFALLVMPSAVAYGVYHALDTWQTTQRRNKADRNRIDRDMNYIALFRGNR